jgi:hypothetical protein
VILPKNLPFIGLKNGGSWTRILNYLLGKIGPNMLGVVLPLMSGKKKVEGLENVLKVGAIESESRNLKKKILWGNMTL